MKKYGKNLVSCMPEQTTNLLMDLCTNYKPKGTKGSLPPPSIIRRAMRCDTMKALVLILGLGFVLAEATESFAQPRPKVRSWLFASR